MHFKIWLIIKSYLGLSFHTHFGNVPCSKKWIRVRHNLFPACWVLKISRICPRQTLREAGVPPLHPCLCRWKLTKDAGNIQLLRCTGTATESWLLSWPHESIQNVGSTTTMNSRGGQEYVCKLSSVKQLCRPEVNVYLALQRRLYEMCRYLVASPRACRCGLGQKEISYGLARDRQELSETEQAFISVPA